MIANKPWTLPFEEAQVLQDLRLLKRTQNLIRSHPLFRDDSQSGAYMRQVWHELLGLEARLGGLLDD